MKLQGVHIFLILLASLFFACCLGTVVEGYTERTAENSSGDSATVYTGANGNKAVVTEENNNMDSNYGNSSTTYGSNGGSIETAEGPYGAQAAKVTGPEGNSAVVTGTRGVSRSNIPRGDEDLYILKSEIVPPVCPKCPSVCPASRTEAPPPCPACARCPEPAFDCKKVPNYKSNNTQFLPKPMLADFSTFGA